MPLAVLLPTLLGSLPLSDRAKLVPELLAANAEVLLMPATLTQLKLTLEVSKGHTRPPTPIAHRPSPITNHPSPIITHHSIPHQQVMKELGAKFVALMYEGLSPPNRVSCLKYLTIDDTFGGAPPGLDPATSGVVPPLPIRSSHRPPNASP